MDKRFKHMTSNRRAGHVTQGWNTCLACTKLWVLLLTLKHAMPGLSYKHLSSQYLRGREAEDLCEFKDSQGYKIRPCFKNKINKTKNAKTSNS